MTPEERERAEEFIRQLRDDVSLLDDLPDKGWAAVKVSDLIKAVEAFAREERARALEEFVQYVERKRWTGHLKDLKTLPQYMAEFKALREEGREQLWMRDGLTGQD